MRFAAVIVMMLSLAVFCGTVSVEAQSGQEWTREYSYSQRERFIGIVEQQVKDLEDRFKTGRDPELDLRLAELKNELNRLRNADKLGWEQARENTQSALRELQQTLEKEVSSPYGTHSFDDTRQGY